MPSVLDFIPTPETLDQWDAVLPPAPKPVASYVPCVQTGNLLFTAGTLPIKEGKVAFTGKVGSIDVPLTVGIEAAQLCVLNALSTIKAHVGSLHNIKRVVKVTGFVNSAPSFTQQPQVMNGASDLLVQILGEAGKHCRSAVGVAELPLDAAVEVELIVEV